MWIVRLALRRPYTFTVMALGVKLNDFMTTFVPPVSPPVVPPPQATRVSVRASSATFARRKKYAKEGNILPVTA